MWATGTHANESLQRVRARTCHMLTVSDDGRDRLRAVQPGDRWLVAVAHPDDEAFVCGSLIAHAASMGAAVTVLCATRGELGESAIELPVGVTLGEQRAAELRDAVALLGGTVRLLGHHDSGFDGEMPDGAFCAADADMLRGELLHHIEQIRPHVVCVLDGSDGHRDHLFMRAAIIDALHVHTDDVLLYESILPNSLMRRWLAEMRDLRPDTVYMSIDPDTFGRPDLEVTDVLDQSHLLALREAAMAAHRSQTTPFDGLSDDLRRSFISSDYLARVPIIRT